jgi:hypothetical protein
MHIYFSDVIVFIIFPPQMCSWLKEKKKSSYTTCEIPLKQEWMSYKFATSNHGVHIVPAPSCVSILVAGIVAVYVCF